jgi:hypothetical protein
MPAGGRGVSGTGFVHRRSAATPTHLRSIRGLAEDERVSNVFSSLFLGAQAVGLCWAWACLWPFFRCSVYFSITRLVV